MNKTMMADMGLLMVAIVWGSGYVAVSLALDAHIAPCYLLAFRFLGAALLISLFFWRKLKQISRANIAAGLLIGILLFLAFALQTIGLEYTTASNNAFITSANVIIVPFLYWLIKRQKPDVFAFSASFIMLVGLCVLSLNDLQRINVGDLMTLGCALFFAGHIMIVSHFTKNHDPVLLTLLQLFFAGILAAITALIFERPPEALTLQAWGSIGYLTLFSTLLCYIGQNVCQKFTAPTNAAIILSTESLFGALLAIIMLDEGLTNSLCIGGGLIFTAVIIAETRLSFLPFKSRFTAPTES
ncbi:hypothetical protein CI610_02015 [invertebrate metagenome]|uniref:EamA domain-containing protein n=1 Tax=invertebrate metagenome TaxID=1711999 RepID=A0A2H9T757_9ZZZZ